MKRGFAIALGMLLVLAAASPARSEDTLFARSKVAPAVPLRVLPFRLADVRLLDGPFKQAMERDLEYVLGLDPDRLLHTFRLTAGLPSSAEPYGGWEKPDVEVRGHFLGHYLSACAFLWAATGDARAKARAESLVEELAKCQKGLGATGYLSAFPEEQFDRVFSVREVWAPFYTIHKIMAGLVDVHEQTGNARALEVVEGMARWVKSRTDRSEPRHMEIVLNHTEQGGMNEVLTNLYALTGKPEYLATARRFDERHYTEPLAAHRDALKGEHVNSFIPNVIGAAREYELTGDPVLREMASFFWNEVTRARSYVTGGTSNNELWRTDPFVLSTELGTTSQETCCTYNMLKLTRHLFFWEPSTAYADYYERALWNGVLATQHPANGLTMYFTALTPGMYKTFMTPEDSFWCCSGTGVENHAKYGDSIYFHDRDGVYVNLYIASELRWPENGFGLRQETRFPDEGRTTLVVTAPGRGPTALHVRIPGWIGEGGYVAVNGRSLDTFASPSSYLTLKREWRTGDRIEVVLPMTLRAERMPDDPGVVAFLYGPLVLAGDLGPVGVPESKVYGINKPTGDPVPVPKIPAPLRDPLFGIVPVPGKSLTFRLPASGAGEAMLVPFFRLFDRRNTIYWTLEPGPGDRPAKAPDVPNP